MQTPVQVTFKDMPHSDSVEADAIRRAARLEHYFDRITSCRVVVAAPEHRGRQGRLYSVRIDLTVPGEEIVVNRERRFDHAHEDVYVAMRDAFDAARRRLEDHARRMRGQVKAHAAPAGGRVASLFPDEGYGFITAADGREIYFNANSILDGDFAHVRIDDEVRFTEEAGDKGPQATSVHVAHRRSSEPTR